MAPDAVPCAGLVLAGGRSSRMGRDKALLPWQGRVLIEHQIETLREAGIDTVHVSGDRPAYRGVPDELPDCGPLSGLASIAAQLADIRLVVIPVDMPRLGGTLLRRLCSAQPDTRCVRFEGRVLPMCLVLDATTRVALATLMSATDARGRSLRALQTRLGVTELPFCDAERSQFTDCNTPTQWREVTT